MSGLQTLELQNTWLYFLNFYYFIASECFQMSSLSFQLFVAVAYKSYDNIWV